MRPVLFCSESHLAKKYLQAEIKDEREKSYTLPTVYTTPTRTDTANMWMDRSTPPRFLKPPDGSFLLLAPYAFISLLVRLRQVRKGRPA